MTSRLYSTTRALAQAVSVVLSELGLAAIGSPTTVTLIAVYVTGLILLDARPTQTRVARWLPARCHDALNRLLRLLPWSTRALLGVLRTWLRPRGWCGYLCLDDVVIEKAFARKLPWAGWTYSFAKKRKVYGLHVVVLLWCTPDGHWRIPVAFRLWRPQRSCAPHAYQTKLQLADQLLVEVLTARLPFEYVVFDTHYTAGWFTKRLTRLGVTWVGTLPPRTTVIWRQQRLAVAALANQLRPQWRAHLEVRAQALTVVAPTYGRLRLVVTRNRHGNVEYVVTNAVTTDLTTLVRRKHARWSIETIFRDTKQYAGLAACQCWTDQAMVRHVALVLLTFVVLQHLRRHPHESLAAVKERWQLDVLRQGDSPPPPLRACPAELRATA